MVKIIISYVLLIEKKLLPGLNIYVLVSTRVKYNSKARVKMEIRRKNKGKNKNKTNK